LPLAAADNNRPHSESDIENTLVTRLERLQARLQQNKNTVLPVFSIGLGRTAKNVQAIPQSFRQTQQALEIGRRLFGENKIHSFAHLGVYRQIGRASCRERGDLMRGVEGRIEK